MEFTGISRKAQKILQEQRIDDLKILIDFTPQMLKNLGIPIGDIYLLRSQLKKRFGQGHLTQKGWSKTKIRCLRGHQSKGGSMFPPGTDEGVIKRFIHSATTGKHYKKPRKRGLF